MKKSVKFGEFSNKKNAPFFHAACPCVIQLLQYFLYKTVDAAEANEKQQSASSYKLLHIPASVPWKF